MSLSQVIPCNRIKPLRLSDERKKLVKAVDKELAEKLALAIDSEGLLHPIGVRPILDEPGWFEIIFGRHRHHAVWKVLKEDGIEAKVFEDIDDDDAWQIALSENLWRTPGMQKARFYAQIKEWHDLYCRKHPEKVGRGKAGLAAINGPSDTPAPPVPDATAAPEDASSGMDGAKGYSVSLWTEGHEQPAEEGKDSTPAGNFADHVSAITGKSVPAAKIDIKISKSFTADQLEALEQQGVSQAMQLKIARMADQVRRGEAVNLIASGMEPEAAYKSLADAAPSPASAAAERKKSEADMSDEDWLTTYCGEFRCLLKAFPGILAAYDRDALFYRHDREDRLAYSKKNRKRLDAMLKAGVRGPFINTVARVCRASHPRDWLLCGTCKGSGESVNGKCPGCFGGGYRTKTETT